MGPSVQAHEKSTTNGISIFNILIQPFLAAFQEIIHL
jgi:hypothetical protein